MEANIEERVRGLAKPLWESAARPYGMAMDFWLMAEQMVIEMMVSTAKLQDKVVSSPPPLPPFLGEKPDDAPVARVRDLAHCMWESAGRQLGMAQEFWLAAERHVLAVMRAAAALPVDGNGDQWAAELSGLSPAAYLERVRLMAYYSWEATGRSYGKALDYWVQAERDLLEKLAASAQPGAPGAAAAPAAETTEPATPAAAEDTASSTDATAQTGEQPAVTQAAAAPATAKRRSTAGRRTKVAATTA